MKIGPAEKDQVISEKGFDALYTSRLYPARHSGWHKEDSKWKADRILEAVPQTLWQSGGDGPLKLWDAGCGAGGVLGNMIRTLKTRGISSSGVGTDLSEEALDMAKRDWPEIEFRNTAADRMPEFFDIGLLIDVVEHVENPWELVRPVRDRCHFLIFHIPLDASWLAECFNLYPYKMETMGHIHFFTYRQALAFVQSCGLKIISTRLTTAFSEPSAYGIDLRHRLLWFPRKILSFLSPRLCATLLGGFSLLIVARSPQTPRMG